MGLFDNWSGGRSRDDIAESSARAMQQLTAARDRALAAIRAGIDPARADVNAGYDTARGNIMDASALARGDISGGFDRARGDLTDQYGRAIGTTNDAYARTAGLLNPLIELGRKYDTGYADAMGVNGADARKAWFDSNVRNNGDFAYADDLAAKALEAKLNAAGITGGRSAALQERQGAQRVEDRTNQFLDRLKAGGDRGAQYTGQLAGYSQDAGRTVAGYQAGLGDRFGTLETGRGTALGNVDMTTGTEMARNATDRGNTLANIGMNAAGKESDLQYGYGQQTAANTINTGNATAATRGMGLNNLLSVAGTVLRGFTPTTNGTSAFGNIWGGISNLAWNKGGLGG